MKSFLVRFEAFLHARGLRLTNQRAEVLRAIYRTHRHVTAEDLYDLLRNSPTTKDLRISRATVYRTLSLLEEGRFVEGLDTGRDKGVRYEHTLGHEHHDHMVCLRCGRIIEFHDEALEAIQVDIVGRHGFTMQSHRLTIHGFCERCNAQAAGAPRQDGEHGG